MRRRRRRQLPDALEVRLPGGASVMAHVRESTRARRGRVRVGPDLPLELVVPRGTARNAAVAMLAGRAEWIARQMARMEGLRARPDVLGLDRPGHAWHEGRPIPIRLHEGERAVARAREGTLVVSCTDPSRALAAVDRWYRREARDRLAHEVQRVAPSLGVTAGPISIRDQRARWGSCSSSGRLSFNWRLLLAPDAVLRYLVVHELSHLHEPNHSRAFWEVVASAMPEWRRHDDWLRTHGPELRRYRVRLSP